MSLVLRRQEKLLGIFPIGVPLLWVEPLHIEVEQLVLAHFPQDLVDMGDGRASLFRVRATDTDELILGGALEPIEGQILGGDTLLPGQIADFRSVAE